MTVSKANALRLASNAADLGAVTLSGLLSQGEDGQYFVGDRSLSDWLERNVDQEVVVVLASVEADSNGLRRTCGVCGRDFKGTECPHCARARRRLRGR
jgi:hypothetical protein